MKREKGVEQVTQTHLSIEMVRRRCLRSLFGLRVVSCSEIAPCLIHYADTEVVLNFGSKKQTEIPE